MSRHRNVRTMNYDDEYDDDDDYQYGHSVEDECISPTDAQQWMYDRAKGQQSISAFLANNQDIEEEDDDDLDAERTGKANIQFKRRDSECYQIPELEEEDRVRLVSCMDEIRNIVGESVTDRQLVEAIMKHSYDFNMALDEVLNSSKAPSTSTTLGKKNKPVQEHVEKDFKQFTAYNSLQTSTLPVFKLPNVQFGKNSSPGLKVGTNLSDLVKSRMKKEYSDSEASSDSEESCDTRTMGHGLVTKLSDLSIASDSGIVSSAESTFSNLTDLAKHHLQAKGETPIGSPLGGKTGSFTVPNLFNIPALGPPACLNNTVRKRVQSPLGSKEWIVDLNSTLIKDKSEINAHKRKDRSIDTENGPPITCDFIDYDVSEQKPILDEFCSMDSSSLLNLKLTNVTSISSGLGYVLCTRYGKQNKVRVKHGFISKPSVVPFRFNIPSPDDVVLSYLRKNKGTAIVK